MGARGTVSPQTNVTSVVGEGGVCIVPRNLPGSAGRTNLCALSPDEVKALREFKLGACECQSYFGDEGADSGQRTKEVAAYYHQQLEPRGELPYFDYSDSFAEDARRGIRDMHGLW